MPIFTPELEEIANRDPGLYEILRKVVNAVNDSPILRGKGYPEGRVAGRPGMMYVAEDPRMGDAVFIKLSGTGKTGWAVLGNSLSGMVNTVQKISGSTTQAAFTTVASTTVILPPNIRELSATLTLTGSGAARLKIGNVVSNEITASGTARLVGMPVGTQTLEIQAKASADSVTAEVQLIQSAFIAGDQMVGGTAQVGGTGGGSGPQGSAPGAAGLDEEIGPGNIGNVGLLL